MILYFGFTLLKSDWFRLPLGPFPIEVNIRCRDIRCISILEQDVSPRTIAPVHVRTMNGQVIKEEHIARLGWARGSRR